MASSNSGYLFRPRVHGNIAPYTGRRSRFMRWLCKFFKGTGTGVSNGHHPQVNGEENLFHGPIKPVDDRSKAENEDLDRAIALSLDEDAKRPNAAGYKGRGNDDDELARAIQESLSMSSSQPYYPVQVLPRGYRICGGCHHEIGYGHYLSCMGTFWHPQCFRCHACGQIICENEFTLSGIDPYHKSCYKELLHPKCDVCHEFIPTNRAGLIEYRAHPFWGQKYCPSHEHDRTPRCCSCERMEILRRPKIGGNRILDMRTFPQKLTRQCEVTAILVLYGLPRLLTGSILAHELMHGWLRLRGYQNLSPDVEEGICQVLAHMWLESEVLPGSTSMPSSSSSSSSSIPSSKKAGKSATDKKLGEFFMHQIAQDTSPAYGEGFRAANAAVNKYGLRRTLEHIRLRSNFPM
ncbi:LIM domain-containing protein HDR3 isoform X3 [Musa acuminata AAA Group]|uniref:LIM domain-containing protein HDR3 isoform X3 n=1 Tax=Musa acuminata AAA Group TaxID=214697 RepID=UPI0031DD580C